jgi:uncharacterized protein involved in exopolysaccharide biosynthesis
MTVQDPYTSRSIDVLEERLVSDGNNISPNGTLIEILTLLAGHKRLILAVTGAAILVGLVYGLTLPTIYKATTKIMTPQQSPSTASLLMSQLANSGAGSLAAAASGGLGLRNPNDIYMGMLNSRPVADAIIGQFGLAATYRSKTMTDARKKLADNTELTSEKSGFIAISVTDEDRKRAAAMANSYTEELRVLTKVLAVTEASQRRIFYEDQLKHAKEDLIAAEISFQQIQQKKGLVQLDAQAKALIANLAALHTQVAAKQVEVQAIRSYSTELNPDVRLAENELSSLQAETARLEKSNHGPAVGDLDLQDVAGSGLDYLRAEHELQYRQVMFDLLLKQYDAARLDEAKNGMVVQVVEIAIPPDRKFSPHRASIVLIFAVLGLLGACSYLFVCSVAHRFAEVRPAPLAREGNLGIGQWRRVPGGAREQSPEQTQPPTTSQGVRA